MEPNLFWTIIGTGIGVTSLIYAVIRNFKNDITLEIHAMENRLNQRMDKFEDRLISMDERLFYLATGEHLDDVIKRERKEKEK